MLTLIQKGLLFIDGFIRPTTQKMSQFFENKRIAVTGGAGFLGHHLMDRFQERGVSAEQILIPLIEDYDLTKESDVVRMYETMQPDIVIHLAAEVGGIGANRENPGRFFYANMAMGLHLIEQARIRGSAQLSADDAGGADRKGGWMEQA